MIAASARGCELSWTSPFPAGWRPEAFELLTRCMLAVGSSEDAATAAASSASASQGLPMHGAFADRAAAAVALDGGELMVGG